MTVRAFPTELSPDRSRVIRRVALMAGAVVAVVAVTVLTVSVPAVGLVVLGLCLVLPVVLKRPLLLVYATVVMAFVTLPAAVPTTFVLGAFSFRAYELLLLVAVAYVVATHPAGRTVRRAELLLYTLLGLWSAVGIANGNGFEWVVGDVRPLVFLAFSFSMAGRLIRTSVAGVVVRMMVPVLWLSAALTVLGSAAGIAIGGREEFASLSLAADAATRILSPATYASVVVVCIAVAVVISGRAEFRSTLPWLLPATIIVALSFSRNAVISIAVAVLIGLLAGRSAQSWVRTAGHIAIALVLAAIAWSIISATSTTPLSAWIVQQVNSFADRVVEGISSTAIATDTSARYRLDQEDPYLLTSISEQPIVGHGFGHPYKPLFTGRFASEDQAEALSRFAHNFYLWAWVKTGIVGLLVFLAAILAPALVALRHRSTFGIGAVAGLIGLLAASFVAPMPVGAPTSLLVGFLGGACAGLVSGHGATTVVEDGNEDGA
jgi:O-antigen ligase